ncbi:hypothetical protein CDL12_12919 [Handroanthus impetiginosus]|uniref:Dof-type domain-containing protein n=1 Tax=Handroanthus impetiginosus TaxID=429701 RepID=A0A2G9HAC9_9LAMI|nr:hypothetical protein CDL12_12919 [Handroanthus impetiginosus]
MDTAQWPQGIQILKPAVEDPRPAGGTTIEKKPRPQKEQALNCPRRYWTEGGSLRNVPVGGGSRKNKRSSSTTTASISTTNINSISSKKLISSQSFSPQNPKIQQGHDLNLAYNPSCYNGTVSEFHVSLPFGTTNSSSSNSSHIPILGNLSSFMSSETNSVPYNSSSLNFIDFKPNLGFSLDGLENGYGNIQGVEDHHHHHHHHHNTNTSRSFLFPFEELNKPVSTNDQFEAHEDHRVQGEANGYWNGMLAGGSW